MSTAVTIIVAVAVAAVLILGILRFVLGQAVQEEARRGPEAPPHAASGGSYGEGDWTAGLESSGGGDGD